FFFFFFFFSPPSSLTQRERKKKKKGPAKFDFNLEKINDEELMNHSKEYGPQKRRYEFRDIDCFGLHECSLYGLKGTMAYFAHAEHIRQENKSIYSEEERTEVFKKLYAVFEGLNNNKQELGDYLKLAMDVGAVNIKVLELLDRCHNHMFGVPEPSLVSAAPVPGKCILMSGHDIIDVWRMLEATKDKGINVYTHGELLPSHAYPRLKKYKHFIGHFGSAWQNQVFVFVCNNNNYYCYYYLFCYKNWNGLEFKEFPGSIVMTTNCLMPPRRRYKDRLFTINAVGYEGIPHVDISNSKDMAVVIDKALSLEGFNEVKR
ncbi:hydroxylamine reductase, partial [Reticulomyxa filosa]